MLICERDRHIKALMADKNEDLIRVLRTDPAMSVIYCWCSSQLYRNTDDELVFPKLPDKEINYMNCFYFDEI